MPSLTATNPVHIHLDKFFGRARTEAILQVVEHALLETIDTLGPRLVDVMPAAVLPLKSTQTLIARAPSRVRLQISEEPPSIYLVHRDGPRALRLGELYRVPVDQMMALPRHPDVFCFYEVFRAEKAKAAGWEYTRTILCEHYLPQHRTSWDSTREWP